MGWLEIVKVIGPLVLQLIPELAAMFHKPIVDGIVKAEKDGGTGSEKLNSVLEKSELIGQEPSAVTNGVNAIVALANAIEDIKVSKKGKGE